MDHNNGTAFQPKQNSEDGLWAKSFLMTEETENYSTVNIFHTVHLEEMHLKNVSFESERDT